MRTDNKIAPNPRQRPPEELAALRCRPRSRQRSRKTAGTAANRELLHAVEQPGKLTQTVETVKRAGYGFRNRENSARRIRFHCTRKQRAATQTSS